MRSTCRSDRSCATVKLVPRVTFSTSTSPLPSCSALVQDR
jgi:hypothetical protein